MKILCVDCGQEMRGGQWQTLRLVLGLGRQCVLLCLKNSPLWKAAAAHGLEVAPVSMSTLRRLSRSADLVHAHDARSHTLCALAGVKPLVVSRRVAFPIGQSWLARWKYSRAQHYVAVSHFVRSVLANAGIPQERISVVYDGVPIPEQPLRPGSDILAFSTLDPMKGADLARATGLPVLFTRNLEEDLARAGVFLYLSRSEGLGSAILLAMAAGIPVVASCVGGIPEIIDHQVNGVLTENHPAEIRQAVDFAFSHRQRLGEEARRTILQRFSVDRMVSKTMDVYRQVLTCSI
jgi:glycosyltransferase involved in cell wall biosynthesis